MALTPMLWKPNSNATGTDDTISVLSVVKSISLRLGVSAVKILVAAERI